MAFNTTNSTTNYGAIIGGTVGGILVFILVAALILLIVFCVCLPSLECCLCCADGPSPADYPMTMTDAYSYPYTTQPTASVVQPTTAPPPPQPPMTVITEQPPPNYNSVVTSPNANSPSWVNFSAIRNQLT